MRSFSLAHLSALSCSAAELVSLAAVTGYDAVGLRLSPARRTEQLESMAVGSAAHRETSRRLADTGLSVHDVEVLILYPDTGPGDYLLFFEAAAALGAKHVVVNSEDPDESRAIDTLASQCDAASQFGLTLGLEFMRYRQLTNLGQASRMIASCQMPNARHLIDTLHFFRAGHSVSDLSLISGEDVSFMQISDGLAHSPPFEKLGEEARFDRLAPGLGGLPLADLVAALPAGLAISVEVPTTATVSPIDHATAILAGAKRMAAIAAERRVIRPS